MKIHLPRRRPVIPTLVPGVFRPLASSVLSQWRWFCCWPVASRFAVALGELRLRLLLKFALRYGLFGQVMSLGL